MGSARKVLVCAVMLCAGLCVVGVCSADAAPWWHLDSLSQPTNLPPGGDGTLVVSASDLGNEEANGSSSPMVVRDTLPSGLVATSASGRAGVFGLRGSMNCTVVSGSLVECTFAGSLPSYEALEVKIAVAVQPNAKSGESNDVTVSGGGGTGVSLKRPLVVSGSPTPFGVSGYELEAFEEGGALDTQAGSHPFELTTTLDLNRTSESPFQPVLPKDLRFDLPPGLVGNPQPFPQCSDAQFAKRLEFVNEYSENTAVGVATVTIVEPFFSVLNRSRSLVLCLI